MYLCVLLLLLSMLLLLLLSLGWLNQQQRDWYLARKQHKWNPATDWAALEAPSSALAALPSLRSLSRLSLHCPLPFTILCLFSFSLLLFAFTSFFSRLVFIMITWHLCGWLHPLRWVVQEVKASHHCDRPSDWLTVWLTECQKDWLTDWLTG